MWFLFSFASTALFALTNHIDKFLVSRHGGGIGALIIISSVIDFFVLPVILFFHPEVIDISLSHALLVIVSNVIMLIGYIFYLYALQRDDASLVAPLFQTVPLCAFILGFFILGETVTPHQLIGMFFVIAGAIILTSNFQHHKKHIKYHLLFLMLLSSCLIALATVLFKNVMLETSFWKAAFWGYWGDILVGLWCFFFVKKYRKEFFSSLTRSTHVSIGLNIINECINIVSTLCYKYATLLAPVVLVTSVASFHPLLVFFYSVLFLRFLPKFSHEHIGKKTYVQRILSILMLCAGGLLLL